MSTSDAPEESIPRPARPAVTDWYLALGRAQRGPMDLEEVEAHWDRGEIHVDTLVWHPKMSDWTPLADVRELAYFITTRPRGVDTEPAMPSRPSGAESAREPAEAPVTWRPSTASALSSLVAEELEPVKKPQASAPPPPGGLPHDLFGWALPVFETAKPAASPPPSEALLVQAMPWHVPGPPVRQAGSRRGLVMLAAIALVATTALSATALVLTLTRGEPDATLLGAEGTPAAPVDASAIAAPSVAPAPDAPAPTPTEATAATPVLAPAAAAAAPEAAPAAVAASSTGGAPTPSAPVAARPSTGPEPGAPVAAANGEGVEEGDDEESDDEETDDGETDDGETGDDAEAAGEEAAASASAQPAAVPSGPLTREQILLGVKENAASVLPCLKAAREQGELVPGSHKVILDWSVSPSGAVANPRFTGPDALLGTSLPACFAQKMAQWRFPASAQGAPVKNYPFGPFTVK